MFFVISLLNTVRPLIVVARFCLHLLYREDITYTEDLYVLTTASGGALMQTVLRQPGLMQPVLIQPQ